MFFYLSKIIGGLIWPTSIITLLLVSGGVMLYFHLWPVLCRRLLLTGIALLLICGLSPLGNMLVVPLEQRFPKGDVPEDISGVIMLGGFESSSISLTRKQLSLNDSAERLTEGVLVALSRPRARVIFSGGDGTLRRTQGTAAGRVGEYFEAMGIAPDRIVLEGNSRTTFENATELQRILKPRPGEQFVLVTSAYHMPRSIGTFRRMGFDVIPWPADYRTRGPADAWTSFAVITAGLERVDFSVKEWVGLLAYRLTGRTAELWPGPEPSRAPPARNAVAPPPAAVPAR